VRQLHVVSAPHTRTLSRWRLPGYWTRRREAENADRRGYAVCRRDWTDRLARRRSRHASDIDSDGALRLPGRFDRLAWARQPGGDLTRHAQEHGAYPPAAR